MGKGLKFINMKMRIVTILLTLAMAMTLFVGYASAANADAAADSSRVAYSKTKIDFYPFSFRILAGGRRTTGAPRKKDNPSSMAMYDMDLFVNTTEYPFYLNVRSADRNATVGSASEIPHTGCFAVYYRSGLGSVGEYYIPSAQTDSDSVSGMVTISGTWQP